MIPGAIVADTAWTLCPFGRPCWLTLTYDSLHFPVTLVARQDDVCLDAGLEMVDGVEVEVDDRLGMLKSGESACHVEARLHHFVI